ncbi:MAG: DivIVA domain-containing protein [Actinomycetota bacterium]|nr:DivIVA domain-containing protein [Actinomycetota bacterium]
MDVSSQAIRDVAFRERLRGYNPEDVDEFLERVALGVELLEERLSQAHERARRAERDLEDSGPGGDAVRRTLRLAERTAELAVQEAREEAAQLVAAAREQAGAVLVEAEERARRLAEESQSQLRAEVSRLEVARQQLVHDVSALERFLAEERTRAQTVLAEAAVRLGDLIPGPAAPPEVHDLGARPLPAGRAASEAGAASAYASGDDALVDGRGSAPDVSPGEEATRAG